jgi:hypothetical protein
MTGDEDTDAPPQKEVDISKEKEIIDKCKTMEDIKKAYKQIQASGKAQNRELIEYANKKIEEIKEDIPVIQQ